MPAPAPPNRVTWSRHARAKAAALSTPEVDVEEVLLASHSRRERNRGTAQWLLRAGPWMIAYDHPADNDWTTARIVTL